MPSDTTHWLSKSPGPHLEAESWGRGGRGLYTLGSGGRGRGAGRPRRTYLALWKSCEVRGLQIPLAKLPQSPALAESSPSAPGPQAWHSKTAPQSPSEPSKHQERETHPPKASKATHPLSASFPGRVTSSLETNEKHGPPRKERGREQ